MLKWRDKSHIENFYLYSSRCHSDIMRRFTVSSKSAVNANLHSQIHCVLCPPVNRWMEEKTKKKKKYLICSPCRSMVHYIVLIDSIWSMIDFDNHIFRPCIFSSVVIEWTRYVTPLFRRKQIHLHMYLVPTTTATTIYL